MDAAAATAAPPPAQTPATPADQWMYSVDGRTRGPLPGRALLKLYERGVAPAGTLVWAPGRDWTPILEAEGLKERAALARAQFFVAGAGGAREGPFPLGRLRSRFDDGDVDGLTQIFVAGGAAWATVGTLPGLRELLAPEPEPEAPPVDAAEQVYEPEAIPVEERAQPVEAKKKFRADDGKTYVFEDGDWVEKDAASDDEDEADAPAAAPAPAPAAAPKRDRKKKKKGGWDTKSQKCWVYVTGLPGDASSEELVAHFGKCGVVATDPETSQPKVKIYKDEAGRPKGDAALCFLHEASVDAAVSVLDGGSLRFDVKLTVARADFGAARYGAYDASKKRRVNANKVKVAKRAQKQALSWAHDEDSGAAQEKALRIVVVENCFSVADVPDDPTNDETFDDMIEKAAAPSEKWAQALGERLLATLATPADDVDKTTVHRERVDGVVVVKFKKAADALDATKAWDGSEFEGRPLKSFFWDGVTDYTKPLAGTEAAVEAAEAERVDAFGDWIEDQGELPPELRLRVES